MGRNLLEILSGVVIPRAPSSSSDASLDASSVNEPLVDRVLLGDGSWGSSGIVVGSGDTGFVLAGSCWAIL